MATSPATPAPGYLERPEVVEFLERATNELDLETEQARAMLGSARRSESVLKAISRPAEKRLNWAAYRRIFLKPDRIAEGVSFWSAHQATLERAQDRFGVPPEIVVAIIGVETRYGQHRGTHRVIDALATLAFDYPPRSKFFSGELAQYLRLAADEGWDVNAIVGSYAGAMGFGQFIPSSYRAYAVDFDDDGRRDLLTNKVDAIGSVANYFSRHGWRAGEMAYAVAKGAEAASNLISNGLRLDSTAGQLSASGVTGGGDLPAATPVALVSYEGDDGFEYWMTFNNFYVITRYNRSKLYARAVLDLAAEIAAARARTMEPSQ